MMMMMVMVMLMVMIVISPELRTCCSLQKCEHKCSKRTLPDAVKTKASLTHCPVQCLSLRFFQHISIDEGFSLTGKEISILHPETNNITSIIELAVGKAVDTVRSQVKRHKPPSLPGTDSFSNSLLQYFTV